MSKIYEVPLRSQPNPRLCAVACGGMMWLWRIGEKGGSAAEFLALAGPLMVKGVGQNETELSSFFGSLKLIQLGGAASKVPTLKRATGANVRYALKWSPVIVAIDPEAGDNRGHIAVVIGHGNGGYTLADPSGNQTVNFGGTDKNEADYTFKPTGILDRTMAPFIWYWA